MKKIGNFIRFCTGCLVVVVTGEVCLGMVEAGIDKIRAFINKKETPETKIHRWFCRDYEEDTSDDDTVVKGFAAR